jgi:predicted extracellular nuclease
MRCLKITAVALVTLAAAIPVLAESTVFINEIHYDNSGTDQGEAIEVAGPAGTDLSGWSIVLYNGSTGSSYNTTSLSGTLTDGCGGWGVTHVTYAVNGIQNGSPDGIALVDNGGNVLQFLSYEGSFTAADGPAGGMTSTDIGVAESSGTLVGNSLQLNGTGSSYEDFTWSAAAANTFGACNTGQTFLPPPVDLLLSEIVVTPTGGEFIEIHNPMGAAVDLSSVYLTDATYANGSTYYYNIVTGANAGGGGFGDFHARFPDGATIGPAEFQTVSLAGSEDFFAAYGVDPTYELYEDGVGADAIPDMRDALPGSINNQGGLSDSGEVVILYTWDGASDLVQDLDYALWGDTVEAVDKTGVVIDGPDADAVTSAYLADTAIASQDLVFVGAHSVGDSFQRIDFSEGTEAQTGGNGSTGSDETSEDLSVTWSLASATPGAAPAVWIINEILADPASDLSGDANGDGVRDGSQDEFVEIVNVSGSAVDISGWTLSDAVGVRHTFPAGTVIPDQCGIVVFGGGTPTGSFGNMTVQTASGGYLGLNNGGDSIFLNDGSSNVAAASYGSEGGENQSLTLDPDVGSPPYVKHSLATGSGGALFSPGTRIDGSSFSGCPLPMNWVINEILADPASGAAGDANGDGVRNGSQDEFVEIVNLSGGAADISGWTLSDAVGVRHTFPAGTVIPDQCGIVVFGGGTPTGSFGNMTVQTASGGYLGLNNGGDSIFLNDGSSDVAMASYGGEGGDNQSLTLDPDLGSPPYVKHSVATGSGGALFSPGAKIDGSPFSGCPLPIHWVINEFQADPASDLAGDANGDGHRDGSQDEFVEIVNVSGSAVDISGWTLSDAVGVRHTFPADTLIPDQCGIVVFGGGTPTGSFGSMAVQTASGGFLGLNNGGDSISLNDGSSNVAAASYGGEGGDNQSLTLDPDLGSPPYVKHSLATGSGGALYSPGTRIDGSQFGGCPVSAEIYQIQGAGAASPFDGLVVTTLGNVVTATAPNGFFMQTPADRADGDIDTSDGIFVFTGSSPGVAVGHLVDVTGEVDEFFGMTEITTPSVVTVVGAGTVPQPVAFDAFVPSPDPALSSCDIEYECYEGMLVEIEDGTVTGPNQQFGTDPVAEVHIVASPQRAFREPGIEFPGIATYPIWDGNPEVFELDPDKLGLPNQMIPAGSSFSAVGVLGFEFGGYELWPFELEVTPAPLPYAVFPREPGEFTVATLNLFRLFDDVDDPPDGPRDDFVVSAAEYARRLAKFSAHIREVLDSPDILAVQEAEKLEVLQDLAARIVADDPTISYTAHLVEGNDVGTIDIGFMVRDRIQVDTITQLGADELFDFDDPASLLHDRPPLLLEGGCQLEFGSSPIAVLAVHVRSLSGIDSSSTGARVRQKRFEQAESIATMVQDIQIANPELRLIVAGDFNAFEFADGYVDVVGIIKGDFVPADNLICGTEICTDITEPNFTDAILNLPVEERYSFIFNGSAQALDHALTSATISPEISAVAFGRGNTDAAEVLIDDDGFEADLSMRSSDHDGLVLYILNDEDNDGVPNNLDMCAGTAIPESVPTRELGTNRWALVDEDGNFDTNLPNGRGKGLDRSFTLGDTAGCSCEQIIDLLDLGKGHEKFGCSTDALQDWIEEVSD